MSKSRLQRKVPDGVHPDAWRAFLRLGSTYQVGNVVHNTFSGSDTRVLLYMPPNPWDEDHKYGYTQELKNLQTITLSSHRPPGAVRLLGNASAQWVRGARTIAGTMIFSRLDRDPFLELYSRCELERADLYPFFIDQLPPFHVILHAQNEMGLQASAAVVNVTLTDFGGAHSIEDLTPEDTYSFVADWMHPFLDRDQWMQNIRDAVSWLQEPGGLKAGDLAPDTVDDGVYGDGGRPQAFIT